MWKETYTCGEETYNESSNNSARLCMQDRPTFCEKETYACGKKTYIREKGPANVKRHPHVWKQTCIKRPTTNRQTIAHDSICKRNPHLVKRNPHLVKRNPHLVKRNPHLIKKDPHLVKRNPHLVKRNPHLVKNDLRMWKEAYIYGKRPTHVTRNLWDGYN